MSDLIFDSWHHRTCDSIMNAIVQMGFEFTYGHAQKWINMTFKYLYMLEAVTPRLRFSFLHVPIDNIIFRGANKQFGIQTFSKCVE